MRAYRLNSGTLASTYSPNVGQGEVSGDAHLSTQSIHFAGDVPFCRPTDGAIARQVANSIQAHGDASRFAAHSRAGKRGLNARMPGANHHDVESFHPYIVTYEALATTYGWDKCEFLAFSKSIAGTHKLIVGREAT